MTTAKHLREIPDLAAEAWNTRGTKAITAESAGARSIPGSRCLADLDRLVALDPAHTDGLGVLSTWVRHIAGEMDEAAHPHDWPDDNVAAACGWLVAALPWCAGRGWEDELADDVRRLWGALRHICGRVEPKPLPCFTYGCPGTLSEVDGMLQCQIGHRHDGLRKWRLHPSMTEPEIAEQFNVTVQRLRVWRSRGKLARDAKRPDAVRVYPWDVLRLLHPEMVGLIEMAEGKDGEAGAA